MDGHHHQQDRLLLSSASGPVIVVLDIDADVLTWLQEKPFWRREITGLLRFYMETHLIREAAFEPVPAQAGNAAAADYEGGF